MAIGDLLAEILGDEKLPEKSGSKIQSATFAGLKRKADSEPIGTSSSKIARSQKLLHSASTASPTSPSSSSSFTRPALSRNTSDAKTPYQSQANRQQHVALPTRPSLVIERPKSSVSSNPPRPVNASSSSSSSSTSSPWSSTMSDRPYRGTARAPSSTDRPIDRPIDRKPPLPTTTYRPSPVKPATKITSKPVESSKPPKKGSFQEIMARAAKAQETGGPKHGIVHKSTEKPAPTKGRLMGTTGTTGTTNGGKIAPRSVKVPDARNGFAKDGPCKPSKPSKPGGRGASAKSEIPEKKIKKSVAASTGYQGTARPAVSVVKKTAAVGMGRPTPTAPRTAGGLLAPPPTGRRQREEDEYDEELDDFIDYDEEDDDGGGPRYDYYSDASSDMEAGMDELDVEESRAARLARDEDRREEALERKLKQQKEERRQRLR